MGKPAQEAGDMGRLAQGAVELEHSGPGANKVHSQQNIHHNQKPITAYIDIHPQQLSYELL